MKEINLSYIESLEAQLERLTREQDELKSKMLALKKHVSNNQIASSSSSLLCLSDESPQQQIKDSRKAEQSNISDSVLKQHVYASSTRNNIQGLIEIHSNHLLTPPYSSIESPTTDTVKNLESLGNLQSTPSIPEFSIPEHQSLTPNKNDISSNNQSTDKSIRVLPITQTVQTSYNDGVVELYRNDDFNSYPSQVELNNGDAQKNESLLNSVLPDNTHDKVLDNENFGEHQQERMSENQSLFENDDTVENVLPNSFDMNDFLNFCNDIPCDVGQPGVDVEDDVLHPVENVNCQNSDEPQEAMAGNPISEEIDKMLVSSTSSGTLAQQPKVQQTVPLKSLSESDMTQNSVIELPIETDGLRSLSNAVDMAVDRCPSVVIENQTKEFMNFESDKNTQVLSPGHMETVNPVNIPDPMNPSIFPPDPMISAAFSPGNTAAADPMNSPVFLPDPVISPAFSPGHSKGADSVNIPGPMSSPVPVTSTSDINISALLNTAPVTFGRITKRRKTVDYVRSLRGRGRGRGRGRAQCKDPNSAKVQNETKTEDPEILKLPPKPNKTKETDPSSVQIVNRVRTRRYSLVYVENSNPVTTPVTEGINKELDKLEIQTPPPSKSVKVMDVQPTPKIKLISKRTQTVLKMSDIEGIASVIKEPKKPKTRSRRVTKSVGKCPNKRQKLAMTISDDFNESKPLQSGLKKLRVVVRKEEVGQSDIEEFKKNFH